MKVNINGVWKDDVDKGSGGGTLSTDFSPGAYLESAGGISFKVPSGAVAGDVLILFGYKTLTGGDAINRIFSRKLSQSEINSGSFIIGYITPSSTDKINYLILRLT